MHRLSKEELKAADGLSEDELIEEEIEELAKQNKKYLRPKEIFAYLLADFIGGSSNPVNMQFYWMNFFNISGKQYANLALFTSMYDALDDPISGFIIDRTRTRWGHFRPYLVIMLPLSMISVFLNYTVLPGLATTQQIMVQLYVTCILGGLAGSYGSAGGLMIYFITPNPNERNWLMTIQQFFSYFSGWIPSVLSVVVTYIPRMFPGVRMQNIYRNYAYIFFVLGVIATIYKFLNTRERFPLPSRKEMKEASIWESVKFAVTTRPFLVGIIANVFGGLQGNLRTSSENFFWLNNTGSLANGFLASLLTGLPKYFITPFVPKVIKRFGERNVYIAGHLWAAVCFVIMWLIGYVPFGKKRMALNVIYLAVALTIMQIPNSSNGVAGRVMTADTFDYIEWKYGVRSEGLVSAANNWFGKLNNSLQGWITGMAYQIIGYVALKDQYGNLIPQTSPRILKGIWMIFALIPAASKLLVAVTYMFFNVHGKFKEQMEAELAVRRREKLEQQQREEAKAPPQA